MTIPAGSASADVAVLPLRDQAAESGETVVLNLAAAPHYARGAARSLHVVIVDDDRSPGVPIVGVLATGPTIGEPADGAVLTFTRTGATAAPPTVRLHVAGAATPGADHVPLGTSVVIPAGAAWARVPVDVLDDALVEGIEDVSVTLVGDPAYRVGAAAGERLWIGDDEAVAPAAVSVELAVGPLAIGRTGVATVTGGAPGGFATIWIGLAPDHLVIPPFSTVQLAPSLAGPFATGLLDATGSSTALLAIPPTPSLAGAACWWQAFAATNAAPFGALSGVAARVGGGPAVR